MFSNIQHLAVRMPFARKFDAMFPLHSEYKSLCLYQGFEIVESPSGKYFKFTYHSIHEINSIIKLINHSKNVSTLALNFDSFSLLLPNLSCDQRQCLKSSVLSLTGLKSFRSGIPFDPAEFFNVPSSLLSVRMPNDNEVDWNSLAKLLQDLEHLSAPLPSPEDFDNFLRFLRIQKLKSIFLTCPKLEPQQIKWILLELESIPHLNSIELDFEYSNVCPAFELSERIQALSSRIFDLDSEESLTCLPFGLGVKYLRIEIPLLSRSQYTFADVCILKGKFPNLEVLVLPFSIQFHIPTDKIGFQVYFGTRHFEQYFIDCPSLSIYS